MKNYVRALAIALALALIGFFGAVGIMTVLFAPQTDSFAPKSSSDAAGWVQAIGSIIAILGSYHIGARQAEEARKQADERRRETAARIKQYEDVIAVLYAVGGQIRTYAAESSAPMFAHIWQTFLDQQSAAALAMYAAIPVHELGGPQRIEPAARIQGCVQNMRELASEITEASPLRPLHYSSIQARIERQGEVLSACMRRFRSTAELI